MPGLPDINDVSDSTGKPIGIIIPPPDIKSHFNLILEIADKTAEYVAKNGSSLEELVYKTEINNIKFCFLKHDDPYRAYYDFKVSEFARGSDTTNINNGSTTDKLNPIQEKLKLEARKEIKQPPPEQFSVRHPTNLTYQKIDIIKHTAQFVAKNGQKFLIGLSEREKNNPTFEFLKPTNSLFTFFTGLVESYAKCFAIKREEILKIQDSIQDPTTVLNRVGERFEYEKYSRNIKRKKDEIDEEERLILAQIDWNDFVVVETIDLKEDEEIPFSNQIQNQNEEEESTTKEQMELEESKRLTQRLFGVEKEPQIKEINHQVRDRFIASIQDNVTIKESYVPKITPSESPMVKCNNCHKFIPAAEMNEHLKIELMDPKFQEMKNELKQRELNSIKSTGEEMTKNLEKFRSKRTDIFGNADELLQNESQETKISNKAFMSQTTISQKSKEEKPSVAKGNPEKKLKGESYFQGSTLSNVPMPNLESANNPFTSANNSQIEEEKEKPTHHLMPEDQYRLICPSNLTINIKCPEYSEEDDWNFSGQTIQLQVQPISRIITIKESISKVLNGMPISRMKFNTMNLYNLKDDNSVAFYNLINGHLITLSVKERGGRNR